jgi:hypothetical protein
MASASCSLVSSAPSLAFVQICGNQQAHRGCLKPSTLLPPLPVRFLSAAAVRRCCPASVCRQNVVCAVATEAPPSQRQGSATSPSGVSGEVKELQHSQNNGASKKKNLKVLIAGGGIGGLVFALAAKNRGFDVSVFEKDLSAIRGEGKYRGPIQVRTLSVLGGCLSDCSACLILEL